MDAGVIDVDKPTRSTAMEAKDLALGFGSATVLSDINVSIPKGAITALIGPTGSGKTTFLRSLNRMNDRVSKHWHKGEVLLEGSSIYAPGVQLMALRRRVGMLFQRPEPFPDVHRGQHPVRGQGPPDRQQSSLRVDRRSAPEGGRALGGRFQPAQLLALQPLWGPAAAPLPRACPRNRPEVLLLDEPTSSLDPVTTENIEAMIRSLAPAVTIIIVTHNLGQARRISDGTIFFYQGKLVEFDETAKLFEDPKGARNGPVCNRPNGLKYCPGNGAG